MLNFGKVILIKLVYFKNQLYREYIGNLCNIPSSLGEPKTALKNYPNLYEYVIVKIDSRVEILSDFALNLLKAISQSISNTRYNKFALIICVQSFIFKYFKIYFSFEYVLFSYLLPFVLRQCHAK